MFFRVSRRLDPISMPFWLHFSGPGHRLGSILAIVDAVLAPFCAKLLLPWGILGARACAGWDGGVTRSDKNFNFHSKTYPN